MHATRKHQHDKQHTHVPSLPAPRSLSFTLRDEGRFDLPKLGDTTRPKPSRTQRALAQPRGAIPRRPDGRNTRSSSASCRLPSPITRPLRRNPAWFRARSGPAPAGARRCRPNPAFRAPCDRFHELLIVVLSGRAIIEGMRPSSAPNSYLRSVHRGQPVSWPRSPERLASPCWSRRAGVRRAVTSRSSNRPALIRPRHRTIRVRWSRRLPSRRLRRCSRTRTACAPTGSRASLTPTPRGRSRTSSQRQGSM